MGLVSYVLAKLEFISSQYERGTVLIADTVKFFNGPTVFFQRPNCQKAKAYTRKDKQLLCEAFYLAESVLEEWCGAAPRRVVRCSARKRKRK